MKSGTETNLLIGLLVVLGLVVVFTWSETILWIIFHVISWGWWTINWLPNAVLGDNWFDLTMELGMFLLAVVAISAVAIIPVKLVFRLCRRRVEYGQLVCVLAAVFILPHFYMSWQLRHVKTEFKLRAYSVGSVEDFSGVEPGNPGRLDYGGSLDELVGARVRNLAASQYVPYFTAHWWTDGMITTVGGAYIYTFLPKSWYDRVLLSVLSLFAANEKEAAELPTAYHAFLAQTDPTLTRDLPPRSGNQRTSDIYLPSSKPTKSERRR